MTRVSLSILILFLLIVGTFSTLGGHRTPGATDPVRPHQAGVSGSPIIGIDCGLGSKEAVLNSTGFPVAPSEIGAFETRNSCTWIGDVALSGGGTTDGTTEPLVSDQDGTFGIVSPLVGGGFTADIVYLQDSVGTVNGFDITVSWNTKVLHAVRFDQGSLPWFAQHPFTAAVGGINNSAGTARLLQVVGTQLPGNFTFFRIRFDVIGVGNTALTISNDLISNPGPVVHTHVNGAFDSETYFDPTRVLNWSGGFTFSPNPPVPGSPTTFLSTVVCPGCTGSLHYEWDFNNDGVIDSIANPATITTPTPTFFVSRVTLKVTDSATPSAHNATIVERLPFTAAAQGPASLPVNTAGTWNGLWLGGIANYAVNWRFCPGTITNTIVCSNPTLSTASQPNQNNTQTLNGPTPGYHFSGVFNVSLRVTDSGAGPVQASTTTGYTAVNVTGGTPVFTVQVTAQGGSVSLPVKASAGVTYSSLYPSLAGFRAGSFKYTLYWGDGASSIVFANAASTSHSYSSAGNYNIVVTAQDMQTPSQIQETGFATVNVAPPDEPPSASFTFAPQTPVVGQDVTFNGTNSHDPDGVIANWGWSFGDGLSVLSLSPFTDHVYNAPGNYSVVLTVTDIAGLTGNETLTILVLPRPQHDIGLTLVAPHPAVVISGQRISFEAGIVNTGTDASTVDLFVYYGSKVAATARSLFVPPSSTSFVYVQWDTTGVPAGNYTISAFVFLSGDPTPADNSLTDGQVMILPPPALTLIPNSGPVGTLVVVHGSGFPSGIELEMTFDNQLVGLFFPQNPSFDFSFDVPDAQVGVHQVHAVEPFFSSLDVQAVFTVTSTPVAISVGLSVGSIYFPGDTATIFVMTSLNGQSTSDSSLQLIIIMPNGSNTTLALVRVATGIYKASYVIATTQSIGTYGVVVKVHQAGSGDGSALASFEVKPTWLSSQSRNIATGIAIAGVVGVAALVWRKGYFRRNEEQAFLDSE